MSSAPAQSSRASKAFDVVRAVAVPLVLAAAIAFFGWFVHGFYPIQKWLFWHYAGYWAACLVWAVACTSTGHVIVKRILGHTLPLLEHVSTSFATGVFAFFFAMNVVGHLQLYRGWMFFALPLAFLAVGARASLRTTRRFVRHARAFRGRGRPRARPVWFWPAVVFGLFGLGMVYFLILTPDNVQFDSRWKHIALAEEFAAHGGLRRFDEGYTVGTYPHLPSFLYGWAFLSPGRFFDHVELSAHVEFTTFLGQLLALPAAVRLLVPRSRPHLAWVVRFLFPGFFLYDSSLSVGADHLGAFFVLPVFCQLVRSLRSLEPRHLALLTFPLAGVGMAKYTCTMIVYPVVGLAIGVRAAWGLGLVVLRRGDALLRKNWLRGPLIAFATLMGLLTVHWVKNWIWYGDPTYPTLYKHLHLRPWTEDAPALFEYGYKEHQFWRPSRDFAGVKQTLAALFSFSFVPNDYGSYHGKVPTFGSLFTLLLAALPFLRRTLRIWGLALMTHGAIFIWFWTHHQDRYLQAILPWLAAVTAALIVKLWGLGGEYSGRLGKPIGWATQGLLVVLISVQAIWGGDVYFIQTHAMVGSPLKRVLDLLATGYKKDYENRYRIYAPYTDVANVLPPRSRVLLHDNHVHAGIGSESVSDWGGWQFGISYVRLGSPAKVWEKYRELGVTHVLWERSAGWDSLGGDLVFYEFATRFTEHQQNVGRLRLGAMPASAPDDSSRNDSVVVVSCSGRSMYATGLYAVTDLSTPVFGPKRLGFPKPRETATDPDTLLAKAELAAVDSTCAVTPKLTKLRSDFVKVANRRWVYQPRGKKGVDLYARKVPGGSAGAPADEPGPDDDSEKMLRDLEGDPQ